MRHLDLFSGIGCFARALDTLLNIEHTFVEYEPHLQRVLRKNYPNSTIHGDITQFTPDFEPWIITGGFPCQDISRANANAVGIAGARSGLWSHYARVISACNPKYVLIENVYDLLLKGLGVVLQDLASLGYDSAWTVIDSKYTGVPQRRRRVYILGVRDGIPLGTDIFQCNHRSTKRVRSQADLVTQNHARTSQEIDREGNPIAFFTRQSFSEFAACGVASALKKRDSKDVTDIVLQSGNLRRLSIKERLRLQGIPDHWLDDCGLTQTQQYAANGMTVPAVVWVLKQLIEFDKHGLDVQH